MESKTTSERKKLRDNPAAIAERLTEAFVTNDLDTVLAALNSVLIAQNVQALSRETGLHRVTLYKSFGGKANPQLGRVLKLLGGLNVRLTVQPMPLEKTATF